MQEKNKPGLVKASSLLFIITILTNFCNYGFHALASRMLGPVDYGALVSMLALLTVIAIPSQAIQIIIAKRVSVEEFSGRLDRIAALLKQFMVRTLLLGILVWLGLTLSSAFWTDFFRLQAKGPIIAVGFAGLVWLVLPVVRGALQGLQKFNHLGLNMLTDGILRLGIGAVFFLVGFGITAGVIAGAISGLIACLLALWPLQNIRNQPIVDVAALDLGQLYRFGVPVVLTLGAFMFLSSMDIIMVKHFFAPQQAGYYSAGALVGKAFLFLPFAVAQVLFPKVSASQAKSEQTHFLLLKSLLLTGGILLGGILAAYFLAPVIILTLFGRDFFNPVTLNLVRVFGMAVAPLALVYILVQYNLALHNKKFVIILFLDFPVFLLALILFHATLYQVLWVVGLNHLSVFSASYLVTPGKKQCP